MAIKTPLTHTALDPALVRSLASAAADRITNPANIPAAKNLQTAGRIAHLLNVPAESIGLHKLNPCETLALYRAVTDTFLRGIEA